MIQVQEGIARRLREVRLRTNDETLIASQVGKTPKFTLPYKATGPHQRAKLCYMTLKKKSVFITGLLSLSLFTAVQTEAATAANRLTINVKVYESLGTYDSPAQVPTFSKATQSLRCKDGIWVNLGFGIKALNENGSTAGIGRINKVSLNKKDLYWEYETDNNDEPTGEVRIFGFCTYSGIISNLRAAQFYSFIFDGDAETDEYDVSSLKKNKWTLNLGVIETGWGEGPSDYDHKSLKNNRP